MDAADQHRQHDDSQEIGELLMQVGKLYHLIHDGLEIRLDLEVVGRWAD